MRRHHSLDHTDSVRHIDSKKPEHKSHPKTKYYKKPKRGRFVVLSVVVILVAVLVYLGVSAYNSANNIFTQDGGLTGLFTQNALKQTDGITNMLILGKGGANHAGGQLTDSILLLRIRQSDKKVATISIPRDLYVTIPGHGEGKVNEAYANGFNSTKDTAQKNQAGADLAAQVVEKVTGVPIHYTTVVDFIGFQKIVDVLGGVTVDVEKNLYDPNYPKDVITQDGQFKETYAYTTVDIKAGVQNMDGDTALKYARSRESTSDFDRSRRQQNLMVAIKDKALSLGILANPVKVNELLSTVGDHMKINMSLSEIKGLVELVQNMKKDEIINRVLDNNPQTGLLNDVNLGGYYLVPRAGNFSAIQSMVKSIFGGFNTDTPEVISVEVLNGSGVVGSAGKFAQILKDEGIKIVNIGNNPSIVSKTQIQNGAGNSKVLSQIRSHLNSPEVTQLDEKGKIVVIIGKDYGK